MLADTESDVYGPCIVKITSNAVKSKVYLLKIWVALLVASYLLQMLVIGIVCMITEHVICCLLMLIFDMANLNSKGK